MDLHNLIPSVSELEATVSQIDASTKDQIPPVQMAANVYAETLLRGLAQIPAVNAGNNAARLGPIQALLNAVQRTLANDIPPTIASLRTELSQRIVNEANARISIYNNLVTSPPLITAKVSALTSSALMAHNQVRTDLSSNRISLTAGASAQVVSMTAYEIARDVAPSTALSTQVAALTIANAAQVSSALASQASTADALCTASLTLVSVNPPINLGTDNGAW